MLFFQKVQLSLKAFIDVYIILLTEWSCFEVFYAHTCELMVTGKL